MNKIKLNKLLEIILIIMLLTFVNVLITSITSGVVMVQIAAAGYPRLGFLAAIITSIITYTWIVFNHKLRNYIKNQGESHE